MSIARFHAEWLNLLEIDGPFVTLPVLTERLRSGLEPTDADLVAELRTARGEVEDDPTLHPVWTRWVITRLLGFPDEVLRDGAGIGPRLTHRVAEHGETLRPDFAVVDHGDDGEDNGRLLINIWPAGTDLAQRPAGERWAASPIDRIAELCRATTVRLGLVTNGDTWTLVDAPLDGATGAATWDATLWAEERTTLDAFTTLLGVRRFFTVAEHETLEALLVQSANAEAEVTDQLGKQVRAAVELLVDAMSRADRERNGSVFRELAEAELDRDLEPYIYEAAVTVLMRLVFLLSAEERGLFLLGDPTYDATYAVSTLLGQLDEESNRYGEDVLERRTDAWHRLLATFRMVHAGAAHANLRLPPYGGNLFDPDRFPFLEGRRVDLRDDERATPLRIDNRTVKHILDALQVLRFRGKGGWKEARRLSFRSLGVEQIGHVYEGLLDHGVVQVTADAVALTGKNDPEVALALIEEAAQKGQNALVRWLVELTGDKPKSIEKVLAAVPEPEHLDRLASACDNDPDLAARVAPYIGLLRTDLRGLPQVYLPGSYYVTKSSDRRSSGAYYTPRALAEEMVTHALEPLVYNPGPAEGAERDQWKLKPNLELLDLRICDMAMGSGAFLVAACRYMSERLLEAWDAEGFLPSEPIPLPGGATTPMPDDETDREVLARRLVADRCLYGVDRNPMAVEMAKLSLWLITLAKNRPFTFVDHALRTGDSLLGITDLRQLDSFHLDPARGRQLHGGTLFDPGTRIEPLVRAALEKRRQLESFTVIDVGDTDRKRVLLDHASALLDDLRAVADLVVGAALSTSTATSAADAFDNRLSSVATEVVAALDPDRLDVDRAARMSDLRLKAAYWLDEGRPPLSPARCGFHWVLEFPEVFLDPNFAGFDCVVGNPPFMGGPRVSESFGDSYNAYLGHLFPPFSRRVDLCGFFFRRMDHLLSVSGFCGLLATSSIAEGNTRRGSLDILTEGGGFRIYRARSKFNWPLPGAAVIASAIWMTRSTWARKSLLDGKEAGSIGAMLVGDSLGDPFELAENAGVCFQGGTIWGEGFYLDEASAAEMITADWRNKKVVIPAIGGQELNNQEIPSRWVINFRELAEAEAKTYPLPYEHLAQTMKEWRLGLDKKKYSRIVDAWWKHFHARLDLYDGIARQNLSSVIARSRVSSHHILRLVPSDRFFFDTVSVFLLESPSDFLVLQSSVHQAWAYRFGSRLGVGLRYGAKNCFNTFPRVRLPDADSAVLYAEYEKARFDAAQEHGGSLSATYGALGSVGTSAMRTWAEANMSVDWLVLKAYEWHDLAEEVRSCSSPPDYMEWRAAEEGVLVERLLAMNHSRYNAEAQRGLHPKVKVKADGRSRRTPPEGGSRSLF